jgi:predicted deacetylase
MSKKFLTVSIHDVTPRFRGELEEIFAELDRRKISSRSVLVIPNFQSSHDISCDQNFVAWLHDLRKKGDEIVHHGYEHVSSSRQYNSLPGWLMGEIFALGCAEFQNIGYGEAKRKIRQGKEIFQKAEIKPVGFVAPAWLMNVASERAAVDEGFAYTTSINYFKNYHHGYMKSEVVGFIPVPAFADYLIRTYDLAIHKIILGKRILVRVAIHPQDVQKKGLFEFALEIIEKLKLDREQTTYADFTSRFVLKQPECERI